MLRVVLGKVFMPPRFDRQRLGFGRLLVLAGIHRLPAEVTQRGPIARPSRRRACNTVRLLTYSFATEAPLLN